MKAKNPRAHIRESTKALKEIMQVGLATIAEDLINQVIRNLDRATPSTRIEAIKGVSFSGLRAYKDLLVTALSVIGNEALEMVRKEIPGTSKITLSESMAQILELSEFDKLPTGMKKRIKQKTDMLVEAQTSDLNKALSFQFTSSVDSTDSTAIIRQDLEDAAEEYITGPSISGGASASAADTINGIRKEWFSDEEVLSQIDAFEFKNGDPQSEVCQDLAGTVFTRDDPGFDRYYPPLHWNCKSYVVPIPAGKLGNREISKLQPSSAEIEKTIQFAECCCGCSKK